MFVAFTFPVLWFGLMAFVTYRMSPSAKDMIFAQSRFESRVKQTLMYLTALASAVAGGYVLHTLQKENLGGAIFLAILAGLLAEMIGGFLTAAWGEVFGMEQDQGERLEKAREKHQKIRKKGWPAQ